MSISAIASPLSKPTGIFPFVDPQTGNLSDHGLQLLNQYYNFIVGMNRLTPCNASGTNIITLTPLASSPLITGYVDYEIYTFTAAATTSGPVTMTVVPDTGTLATLKAYKTNGSAQATSGDLVSGSLYLAIYNDALDGGSGGFVVK